MTYCYFNETKGVNNIMGLFDFERMQAQERWAREEKLASEQRALKEKNPQQYRQYVTAQFLRDVKGLKQAIECEAYYPWNFFSGHLKQAKVNALNELSESVSKVGLSQVPVQDILNKHPLATSGLFSRTESLFKGAEEPDSLILR